MVEEEINNQNGESFMSQSDNPFQIQKHGQRVSYDVNIQPIESQQQHFANFMQEYQTAYQFQQSCNEKTFDQLKRNKVYRLKQLKELKFKLPKIEKNYESACANVKNINDGILNTLQQSTQRKLTQSVAERDKKIDKSQDKQVSSKENSSLLEKEQDGQEIASKTYQQNIFVNFSDLIQTSKNQQNSKTCRQQYEDEIANVGDKNINNSQSKRSQILKQQNNKGEVTTPTQEALILQTMLANSPFMFTGGIKGLQSYEFSLRNSINSSPFQSQSIHLQQQIFISQAHQEYQQNKQRKAGLAPLCCNLYQDTKQNIPPLKVRTLNPQSRSKSSLAKK